MIYTVTLNPSIDYIMEVEKANLGQLNRATNTYMLPGGKGINVSRVLKSLKMESTATGFIGGFTGDFVSNSLFNENIQREFIEVDGQTRINVKISSSHESEINAKGPVVTNEQQESLKTVIKGLSSEDLVVLAGSIPSSISQNIYKEIAEICNDRNIPFVVDAERNLLLKALPYKPLLIKPNQHELEEIFSVQISSHEDALLYAKMLVEMGAKYVLVSMGAKGAVMASKEEQYKGSVPSGKVVSTVGSGDSTVAGFIAGMITTKNLEDAFRLGLACGTASAFTEGLAGYKEIVAIQEKIMITKM
ncbi:1-phosphofructokinase [Bacillus coahuilensis]|uniref:1-phosphofructokinase n=2 Tax=Bacillus coahuilensis TaxID=408580 RepID=UPI0001850C4A|nr:1-phosphofructokinase [Bacillus coahuilensis]